MRTCISVLLLVFIVSGVNAQWGKPVVLVAGKVVNARTMGSVGAKVVYEKLPDGVEAGVARSNPTDGSYKITLPQGKNYGYYALAEGYYSETKHFDATNLKEYQEEKELYLYLAPVELDQEVTLNNIFFKKGYTDFTVESIPELDRFVEFLKINKKIEIEIAGHTDNSIEEKKALELSQKRAQAIADYIIKKGVKEKRLTVKGYGGTQPMGFNNSDEGRDKNNRIIFKVIRLEKAKK